MSTQKRPTRKRRGELDPKERAQLAEVQRAARMVRRARQLRRLTIELDKATVKQRGALVVLMHQIAAAYGYVSELTPARIAAGE